MTFVYCIFDYTFDYMRLFLGASLLQKKRKTALQKKKHSIKIFLGLLFASLTLHIFRYLICVCVQRVTSGFLCVDFKLSRVSCFSCKRTSNSKLRKKAGLPIPFWRLKLWYSNMTRGVGACCGFKKHTILFFTSFYERGSAQSPLL